MKNFLILTLTALFLQSCSLSALLPDCRQCVSAIPEEDISPNYSFQDDTICIHHRHRIFFIKNRTKSFSDLIDQAIAVDPFANGCLIDLHFDAGRGCGHTQFVNADGIALGHLLRMEYEQIYIEKNWINNRHESRKVVWKSPFILTRLGAEREFPVCISEFAFHDDPVNDTVDFMSSPEGQKRIAEALICVAKNFDYLVLSAGHHGDRGTRGAYANGGFHEIDFAFGVANAINRKGGKVLQVI